MGFQVDFGVGQLHPGSQSSGGIVGSVAERVDWEVDLKVGGFLQISPRTV